MPVLRRPVAVHQHHAGDLVLIAYDHHWWTVSRNDGPDPYALREGDVLVCDGCGLGFVAQRWPRPLAGQWRAGTVLRRELGRERRRRRRAERKAAA